MDTTTHARPSDIYYEALGTVGSTSSIATTIMSEPGSVQRASLKDTKWTDLKIRLNTPYLFVHLGGCEHIFSISNIRATTLSDEKNSFFLVYHRPSGFVAESAAFAKSTPEPKC